MRKNPSGQALIEIAAATEAAADPNAGNANYVSAMIKNARAIAGRQAEAGDRPLHAEAEELRALLAQDGAIEDLNRSLVRLIRAGTPPAGIHEHLVSVNRAELGESNPRYLARLDGEE
jgi:hypothetical protein